MAEYRIDDKVHEDPWAVQSQRITPLFHQYSTERNLMTPRAKWTGDVLRFAERWEEWKQESDLMDFTDLIETVWREQIPCPYSIAVLFADEAQDYSALELSVVRMWGAEAQYFILAGDDQQCLYHFKGATPEAFLFPEIPQEQKTFLKQSWRLPSKILAHADVWGRKLSRFEPKEFKPREEGGEVLFYSDLDYETRSVTKLIQSELAIEGRTMMLLASCSYMLRPLISAMRDEGILFHNPYKVDNGSWNPLRGVRRLRKFLRIDDGPMTWKDCWSWVECLDSKKSGLKTGAKTTIREYAKDEETGDYEVLTEDFERATGIELPDPDVDWLYPRLLSSKASLFSYGLKLVEKHGARVLLDDPRTIVGTIHSVKGGEAETVIVYPDLSLAGWNAWQRDQDPTIRLFYVAMTRAREKLILASGASSKCINLIRHGRENVRTVGFGNGETS